MAKIDFNSEKIEHYYKGEYTNKDESYIVEVFCDNSKEKKLKSLLSSQFNKFLVDYEEDEKDLDYILHKIHYDINTRLSSRKFRVFQNLNKWAVLIAGIIFFPLLIYSGIVTFKGINSKNKVWVEITSPAWTRAQFSLPDGTTGWLNSNSSIKYNGRFMNDRQVTLTGEAFFDVHKNDKKPFIVNTPEINIEVLGTRFNVASYENENTVEVVLEEGELIVNDKGSNSTCTMNANDLVTYNKILKKFSNKVVVRPYEYISWTEGKLIFRNDPLDVISRRIERWYNVDVELKDISSEDIRLRATFIDESLEEVMSLLEQCLEIDYKIENRTIKPDNSFEREKVIITNRKK